MGSTPTNHTQVEPAADSSDAASPALTTAYRVAAIHSVALRLTSAPTRTALAEVLLSACISTLGAAGGVLAVAEPGESAVALAGVVTIPPAIQAALHPLDPVAPSPLAKALQLPEPLWLRSDQEVTAHYPQLAQAAQHSDLSAWAIAPLRIDGQALGVLAVAFAVPQPFPPEDRAFLSTLALLAAAALAQLQHAEAMQRHAARMQALAEASQAFGQVGQDLDTVLSQITYRVSELVGGACAIRLIDTHKQHLRLAALYHPDADLAAAARELLTASPQRIDEGIGVTVFSQGKPILITAVDQAALRASVRPIFYTHLDRWPLHSLLTVPLRTRAGGLGMLSMSRYAGEPPYSTDDQAFLVDLADRAALAIANAQLYASATQARAAAEHAAARTAQLYAVTAALAETLTLSDVTAVIVAQGMAALGADAGSVRQVSPDGDALVALHVVGYPPDLQIQWETIPLDAPVPMAEAVRLARPILIESSAEVDASWPQFRDSFAALGYQAVALLPLMVAGRPIGTMSFGFFTPRTFAADDRSFLDALARQCAVALERARLYDATQAQAARLGALAEASQLFAAASLDLPSVLDTIAWRIVDVVGDLGVVGLLSDDHQLLRLAAIAHANPEAQAVMEQLLGRFPLGCDDGISSPTLRTGQPQLYPVISAEQLRSMIKPEYWPYLDHFSISSLLVAPLRVNGAVIGALAALRDSPGRPYTDNDLAMLQELADRAALAIANARLYQQASEAIQIRDQFLSIAAHELRTPLTALSGQAQLAQRRLSRGEQTPERLARALAIITRQADRLNAMMRTLLDVGRIERGQFVIERQPLDLVELIDQIVVDVRPDLERHRLIYAPGPQPIMVNGDPLRLEQVIQNVVGNAVKYSPAGGTITVRIEQQAAVAVVTVEDQGVGIPVMALPQLFQRFYRAPNVTAHHISGMGIGLYVVREVVTRHGGTVDVLSSEGEGSIFTITLPTAADAATGGA